MPRKSVPAAALAGFAAAAPVAAPPAARAVQERSFEVRTASQLVDLCATPPSDPAYPQAVQFCHGFAAGALSYYRAASRPGSSPNFCGLPASRQEAADRFVAWTRANPRVADDNPANALFRFLDANYACRR
jgi:Ssp1 endopeptidase immunity protein Rap1a